MHKYFNPYDTPYEAFIAFNNVLHDLKFRIDHPKSTSHKPTRDKAATVKKTIKKKTVAKKAPALKKTVAKETAKKKKVS